MIGSRMHYMFIRFSFIFLCIFSFGWIWMYFFLNILWQSSQSFIWDQRTAYIWSYSYFCFGFEALVITVFLKGPIRFHFDIQFMHTWPNWESELPRYTDKNSVLPVGNPGSSTAGITKMIELLTQRDQESDVLPTWNFTMPKSSRGKLGSYSVVRLIRLITRQFGCGI